jgi:uncharacterized membrane protein YcaP (DUF421 family)
MKHLFFADWPGLWHVAICATVSYLALFAFIRISGKRTLAKLNAFDFVVSVTLGSTLSSMILAKVPIVEGLLAVAIIVRLQFLLAGLARQSKSLEKAINSSPTLVFYDGEFLEQALAKESITREEVYAAVRTYRIHRMENVKAVVMELNGELTVVEKTSGGGVFPTVRTACEVPPTAPDR